MTSNKAGTIAIVALVVAVLAGIAALPQFLVVKPAGNAPTPGGADFDKAVHAYLVKNPQVLQEMAELLQNRQEQAANAQRSSVFEEHRKAIYDSPNQVVLGNPQGDVTLVEFFDYNCGYCRKAHSDIDTLLKTDPKLRVVLKEFPVLGPESVEAARVAVAVHSQAPDKYLAFHDALLSSSDTVDGKAALAEAQKLGLDMDKLSDALAQPSNSDPMKESHKLAQLLGIDGTPTFIIADTLVPGAVGLPALQKAIANARACGKAACS